MWKHPHLEDLLPTRMRSEAKGDGRQRGKNLLSGNIFRVSEVTLSHINLRSGRTKRSYLHSKLPKESQRYGIKQKNSDLMKVVFIYLAYRNQFCMSWLFFSSIVQLLTRIGEKFVHRNILEIFQASFELALAMLS